MNTEYKTIYSRYLRLLVKFLYKLERQAGGDCGFLNARLSADMFALKVQAKVAASFAFRACAAGAHGAMADPGDRVDTVQGLVDYLDEVAQFVENSIQPQPEMVADKAGFKDICMKRDDYLSVFSLPNFFFHLSMVYAIAKKEGFCVTKADFDGIHEYAKGFSWEA